MVIAVWALLIVLALPFLPRIEEPLKVGGFSSDTSEGSRAAVVLQRELGFSPSSMVLIYESDTLPATEPAFQEQVADSLANITDLSFVRDVV
ncbi:MAG: hypothetical protein AVDCRST_MAG87-616, partial [uncultured Thermomicrobiales bacterium]